MMSLELLCRITANMSMYGTTFLYKEIQQRFMLFHLAMEIDNECPMCSDIFFSISSH